MTNYPFTFIRKLGNLISSPDFTRYQKVLTSKVSSSIQNSYSKREPEIVRKITDGLSHSLSMPSGVKVSTKGIFIHGSLSQVKFEYDGQVVQRELGDLIFIFSVIYNGKKYVEKLSISQFKKGDLKNRWNLKNKAQLYLLSRFPSFEGVQRSIISHRQLSLPNISGSLGSYNLLYNPGDFIYITAPLLDNFLSNRKSIGRKEFAVLQWHDFHSCNYLDFFDHVEFLERCLHMYRHFVDVEGFLPLSTEFLGTSHFSSNVYEFMDKYLRGCIGETIFLSGVHINTQVLALIHGIFSSLLQRAQREEEEVIEFAKNFLNIQYAYGGVNDFEKIDFTGDGGGIGIIYTSIDLGEGSKD